MRANIATHDLSVIADVVGLLIGHTIVSWRGGSTCRLLQLSASANDAVRQGRGLATSEMREL